MYSYDVLLTLNVLIDQVLVLFVGLNLFDEQFQPATVSLEQHYSHATNATDTRDCGRTATGRLGAPWVPWALSPPSTPIGQGAGPPHHSPPHQTPNVPNTRHLLSWIWLTFQIIIIVISILLTFLMGELLDDLISSRTGKETKLNWNYNCSLLYV